MTDPVKTNAPNLVRLKDADYEVAPNEPDVSGWDVVLSDDEAIGEVDDLIIDPSIGKVQYLDVELDTKTLGLERDRHVLVPIASAQIDADKEEVVLSGMSRAALLNLPEYNDTANVGTGYEETFRGGLSKDFESKRITRSAEELQIGKRAQHKGEVRVSKHVETSHVTQSVPVQREEVYIERRPVERMVGSEREMHDDEIVVPVIEEELTVEKRPVVKEEIVISKAPVTSQRTVEADVRHEEIDVEPSSRDIHVNDDRNNRGGR